MTRTDASTFTRLSIVAPRSRVDVALPTDVPVIDLLPSLLDMAGERSDDGGASHDGWRLATANGEELDTGRTLRDLQVLDGELLRITPYRAPSIEPIYDDVVDEIASVVRKHTNKRTFVQLGQALMVGGLGLAVSIILLFGRTGYAGAAIAMGFATIALVVGRALSAGRAPMVAAALAACAPMAGLVAGTLAVPGPDDPVGLLLGAAIALAVAIIAFVLIPPGAVILVTEATMAGLLMFGMLVGVLVGAGLAQVVIGVSAVAVAAMSAIPWFTVRVAGLPMPDMPTTAQDLEQSTEPRMPAATLAAKARSAAEISSGAIIGCAILIGVGALTSASQRTVVSMIYAAVLILVLLLRTRSVAAFGPRLALFLSGMVAALVFAVYGGIGLGSLGALSAAMICVAALIIVVLVAMAPPRRRTPVAGRSLELLEAAGLIAVTPLAVGALGLFSYVRHLPQ